MIRRLQDYTADYPGRVDYDVQAGFAPASNAIGVGPNPDYEGKGSPSGGGFNLGGMAGSTLGGVLGGMAGPVGSAIGSAAGGYMGGNSKGTAIGSGIGSLLGAPFGPVGMAVGGFLGGLFGGRSAAAPNNDYNTFGSQAFGGDVAAPDTGYSGAMGGEGYGMSGLGSYATGGVVDQLGGPDPAGADDGYAALQRGEFVVPKQIVDALGGPQGITQLLLGILQQQQSVPMQQPMNQPPMPMQAAMQQPVQQQPPMPMQQAAMGGQ